MSGRNGGSGGKRNRTKDKWNRQLEWEERKMREQKHGKDRKVQIDTQA